ncbi:MASE1 domain-containing protein [Aliamphritea spongicola]|nr:MASE1 domain-containing protein [Aliamphritea spongicola]
MPVAELGAVWLTWWLGDSIGAMIVTPLLLALIKSSPVGRFNRRVSVGIPILGLLLVIGLLFVVTGEREKMNATNCLSVRPVPCIYSWSGRFRKVFSC